MQIPINDLKRQYGRLAGELTSRIADVLSRGIFLFGTETKAFEAEFAGYCGVRHCISVANGTDAIELALRAVGCGADSEVITVANAGNYSTTACNLVGATPVYVDIDRSTLGLRIDAVQEALTPKTRCLIVTHLYGLAVDVPALRRALEAQGRSDVIVIEDCAQAHGARLGNGVVGSFGDLATFSFYPTKNLGAAGDGGAVLTSDDDMADALRRLRQYGWVQKYVSEAPYARNSRLDELQAAILRAKLPSLDEDNERRRSIFAAYRDAAPDGISIVGHDDERFVGHLCVAAVEDRERVRDSLRSAGVATDIHYPVLDCDQPMMQGRPMRSLDLSASRWAVDHILTLPCFPELTDGEVSYVCEQLSSLAV